MDFFEDIFDFGKKKHQKERHHDDHHNRKNHHEYHDDDYHDTHSERNQSQDKVFSRMSKNCTKCSLRLMPEFNFCPHCGTAVQTKTVCSACRTEIPPQAKFCFSCGAKNIE